MEIIFLISLLDIVMEETGCECIGKSAPESARFSVKTIVFDKG